jgi:integrase
LLRGDLLDLRRDVQNKTNSDYVANNVIKILKTIFREAVTQERLNRDPTEGISRIVIKAKEKPIFSREQMRQFFPLDGKGPWATRELKCCFYLAAATGMRRGEVLALRWSNVILLDSDSTLGGYINVCEAVKDSSKDSPVGTPKWGNSRLSPIPRSVAEELRLLRDSKEAAGFPVDSYVFCDKNGVRRHFHWWTDSFNAALRKLQISKADGYTPHCFRHSLNTHLLAKNNGSEGIQEVLKKTFGWTSDQVHKMYTHLQDKNLGVEHLQLQAESVQNLFE